jgi:hypothetical protein
LSQFHQKYIGNKIIADMPSSFLALAMSVWRRQSPTKVGSPPRREACSKQFSTSVDPTTGTTSTWEDAMNKVWLYVGGIIVGTAVLIYAVITTVSSTHPPASDLRTAYETSK